MHFPHEVTTGDAQRIAHLSQTALSDRLNLAIGTSRQLRLETTKLVRKAWRDLEHIDRAAAQFPFPPSSQSG